MRKNLRRGTDRLAVVVTICWYASVAIDAGGPGPAFVELRADIAWALWALIVTPASAYFALLVLAWVVDGFLPDRYDDDEPELPFSM